MSASKRQGPITATELMAQLANDPEYQRRFREAEALRQERARLLGAAEQPIIRDLRDVGIIVDSLWDLVNPPELCPEALPVLMEHLERGGYPERIMERLGRALAVKPSVTYWTRLRQRFLESRDAGEETGAAVALAACAGKDQVDDLISLLSVEAKGDNRLFFVRPILRLGGDRGRDLVESLRDDPVFGKEATALLARRKPRRRDADQKEPDGSA